MHLPLLLVLAACQSPTGVHGLASPASAARLVDSTGTALEGPTDAGTVYGHVVDGLGDIDGDGFEDLAVGALNDAGGYGRVYVYTGSPIGVVTAPAFELDGEATGTQFGSTLAGVGDLNGDGYDDLAVGAYAYNTNTGRVYLYFGSATGFSSTADTVLEGTISGGFFGLAIAGIGDISGDGYNDLAIGAYGVGTGTGAVFLYEGSATGPSTTATLSIGGTAGAAFGTAVAGADVQGDGYADLIVGAPGLNSDTGAVYVFPGGATGLRTTPTTTLNGENASDRFGARVVNAGDENRDGAEEVIVGANGYNSSSGKAYQYAGSRTGLGTTAGWTIEGDAGDLGRAIVGGADFDRNGRPDAAFGESQYDGTIGRVRTFGGDGIAYNTTADDTLSGSASADLFGISIAAADLNGDGADDLVVAAQGAGGIGGVYVYPGSAAPAADNDHDGHSGLDDCNDLDATIYVGAPETTGDEIDSNCDTHETCFVDADDDGYRPDSTSSVDSQNTTCSDPGEATAADPTGDCDDADPDAYPGATETPSDGVDQDCDGSDATGGDTGDTSGGDDTADTGSGDTADSGNDTGTGDDTSAGGDDTGGGGGDDSATTEDKGGCGCTSGGSSGAGALALLLAGAVISRRRRA